MAEGKKSVLLYCDLIHTVEKLSNENAGLLFKHYLRYINDLEPKAENETVDLVFEHIKQGLKRDLKKYKGKIEERSLSGRLGNLKRWHPDLHKKYEEGEDDLESLEEIAKHRKTSLSDNSESLKSQTVANVAVSDSDSDSVKEIEVDVTADNSFLINQLFDRFVKEVESGEHAAAIEQMYMSLKVKKGSLTPLVKEFNGQLIKDNKLHKNTLEFRKHFSGWLNKIEMIGKLDQYKTKRVGSI